MQRAGQLTIEGADSHGWGRKIIQALLSCLTDSDDVRQEAVEILSHTAPKEDWGPSEDRSQGTLAGDIVIALSRFLMADENATALATAFLLRDWLPGIVQLQDADHALQSVLTAVASVADEAEEMAAVAGNILGGLPEEHATPLAAELAKKVSSHLDLSDRIGVLLRDGLIHYLQALPDDVSQDVQQAAASCVTALTTDVESLNPAGRFARHTLPMLLTTTAGRAITPGIAERLIAGIQNQAGQDTQELLNSLQFVFRDQAVRRQYLPRAVQVMHVLTSHNRIEPALSFLAQHIADPAIDTTWPQMFANHWPVLPPDTRSRMAAAAERTDIAGTSLPNLLLEHLLETDDAEPWQYATSLWNHLGAEERSRLLAGAHGRSPELADCLETADSEGVKSVSGIGLVLAG